MIPSSQWSNRCRNGYAVDTLTPAGVETSVHRLEITLNRLLVSSLALAMAATTAVGFAADDVKSGLQLGEHAGFFLVKDVTGPNKDKSLCYR